ncbi:MAG: hypothetical protein INQ03_10935 [Candidatus Heimdallarchaeota archaeon]|nr:hypothetical protein [Candidatus Heimdallarchaeota archaeon]
MQITFLIIVCVVLFIILIYYFKRPPPLDLEELFDEIIRNSTCQHCEADLEDEAMFCEDCGQRAYRD